jgi:glycine hydroxymethyltransferase
MRSGKDNKTRAEQTVSILRKYEENREKSLNLVASENALSPLVREALSSDLAGRYSSEFYGGTGTTRKLIEQAENLAKELYNCEFACVAPISGHLCDLAALNSLTSEGDTIALVSSEHGGYPFDIESFGRKVGFFPFDNDEWTLDYSQLDIFFSENNPKLTILGASAILFPYSIGDVLKHVEERNQVVYDGSHVLGLIAGKQFQDPFRDGVGVLFGSTHKSFPGPQGGIVLGTDKYIYQKIVHQYSVQTSEHPFGQHKGTILVDNVHSHRIVALSLAILEMLEFGTDYAKQVVRNSKALGNALIKRGYPIKTNRSNEVSESHQILMKINGTDGLRLKRHLETCGINIDAFIRIGTAEVTRRGFKEGDMETIADLIHRGMEGNEDASVIRAEVSDLCSTRDGLDYCFNDIDEVLR